MDEADVPISAAISWMLSESAREGWSMMYWAIVRCDREYVGIYLDRFEAFHTSTIV